MDNNWVHSAYSSEPEVDGKIMFQRPKRPARQPPEHQSYSAIFQTPFSSSPHTTGATLP